MIKYTHERLNE